MNKIILKGCLGDLTARSEKMVTSYISVKKKMPTDGAKYDYINLKFLGEAKVKFVNQYLSEGQEVAINGSLEQSKYQTKDGKTAYSYAVIVDEIEFCGGKKAAEPEHDERGFTKPEPVDDSSLPWM